jgi:hypothetical protein
VFQIQVVVLLVQILGKLVILMVLLQRSRQIFRRIWLLVLVLKVVLISRSLQVLFLLPWFVLRKMFLPRVLNCLQEMIVMLASPSLHSIIIGLDSSLKSTTAAGIIFHNCNFAIYIIVCLDSNIKGFKPWQ